ncbi:MULTISPECIES: methyl-accepting chemotaxis protein [unclassified Aureimonas]|uniref:methyl-accepting chemotaxis protein n=1 Tax=unclassified Aureimonas TaxID=2615206 RepID=UPI0006FD7322|nr:MULTISPECIES: methyl-accepting chemotaxis protein [unclassified Aureimonas]KQT53033.1 hypothetical protein ASG62_14125 [Aureimonas sp. Leaf427]KQT80489.1 hypothetical protein ASG54_07975 [Aureimonas sp. Leaf460]
MFNPFRQKKTFREQFADAIMKLSPDGYYVFQDGVIRDCNPATEALLRGSFEQIVGLSPEQIAPEFQADGSRSADRTVGIAEEIKKNGIARFEWTMKRLDGTTFPSFVTLIGSLIDEKPAVLTFIVDMSVMVAMREEGDKARQAEERTKQAQSQAMDALGGALSRLANGDLTVTVAHAMPPAFAKVGADFDLAIETLSSAMSDVATTVGSVDAATRGIADSSNDLAQRTQQQAASLEETVAALSEVTRAVNQTAESSSNAQKVATSARQKAEKGGDVVSQAVEAMSRIETSSQKISQIIGVIDEIAFQTNLLALNAGVEAARAGEAGRGFAVVAQEVRGLAQRSAEAAKEIKSLISTSADEVRTGVDLVTASGRSLKDIVEEVETMTGVIGRIASSAKEQAASLKSISSSADQMDKATQHNAALVEETTAAVQALASDADHLARIVERFRTDERSTGYGHSTEAYRRAA